MRRNLFCSMVFLWSVFSLSAQTPTDYRSCYSLIEIVSPYTTKSPVTKDLPGRPVSEEEGASVCAPGPCGPVRIVPKEGFRAFAEGEKERLKAESLSFDIHGVGNATTLTAIIKGGKDGPTALTYLTQVSMNGQACGIWNTYLKPQSKK